MADDFERLCLAVANTELPCLSRTALGFVLGGPEDVHAIVLAVLREMREPSTAVLVPLYYASYARAEHDTDNSAETWREAIDVLIAQAGEGKR